MKKDLNIVVNLRDLYTDYDEGDIQDTIHEEVTSALTMKLVSQFSEESRKQLADKVIASIDEKYSGLIEERIIKNIKTDNIQIKDRYSRNSQTLQSYINEKFEELIKKEFVEDIITRQVDEMWNKFKERYDEKFASQIIAKLKEAEMLTDDASKFLLEK